MALWARHTVVRRRKIAEHLTGKHNQQRHAGKRASHSIAAAQSVTLNDGTILRFVTTGIEPAAAEERQKLREQTVQKGVRLRIGRRQHVALPAVPVFRQVGY